MGNEASESHPFYSIPEVHNQHFRQRQMQLDYKGFLISLHLAINDSANQVLYTEKPPSPHKSKNRPDSFKVYPAPSNSSKTVATKDCMKKSVAGPRL